MHPLFKYVLFSVTDTLDGNKMVQNSNKIMNKVVFDKTNKIQTVVNLPSQPIFLKVDPCQPHESFKQAATASKL